MTGLRRALGLSVVPVLLAGADNSFLLRNVTVHPVSRPDIANAAVLVRDGKVAAVGAGVSAPRGVRVVDGRGLHVYPGMIDSATQMGLSEIGSVRETNDTGELGDFNPQLRALIAINPDSEHIPVTRVNGVTGAVTLPSGSNAGGSLIAGQAALIRLHGWTWEEMEVNRSAAMAMRFPVIRLRTLNTQTFQFDTRPFADAKREYDEEVRKIATFFEDARRYQRAKANAGAEFRSDRKLEAMLPVLEGKVPLVVVAERERTIRDAIAFADRQKVRLILSGVRRPGKAVEELKARNIPVVLGPTLALPLEEDDPYDAPWTLPKTLHDAGVKFCFGTFGNSFSRNLPYQAANAVAYGLPKEAALRSVTLAAAEIWGAGDRTGSIDVGKSADLVVTDGDLLETRTNVRQLFIAGQEVPLTSKHTELYERYRRRE